MRTTLTSKGQVTLPAAVRAQLGLQAGDRLLVSVMDADTIVLKRLAAARAASLLGLLPRPKKALSVGEMDLGLAGHLRGKHGRERSAK